MKENSGMKYTARGSPVIEIETLVALLNEIERWENPEEIVNGWCEELIKENPVIPLYLEKTCSVFRTKQERTRAYLIGMGVYKLLELQEGNFRVARIWNSAPSS
jgi:hypothetical protein